MSGLLITSHIYLICPEFKKFKKDIIKELNLLKNIYQVFACLNESRMLQHCFIQITKQERVISSDVVVNLL
jgi:hypothetical protein